MKVDWLAVADVLVDPVDHRPVVVDAEREVLVSASAEYGFAMGQPVLLARSERRVDGWRFPAISLADVDRPRPRTTPGSIGKRLRRRMRGGAMRAPRAAPLALLRNMPSQSRHRVLVVGGATVGEGADPLVEAPDVDVISFDVYPTPSTTFVADGHRIPLADGSVSLVWIQAVLEHVYRPADVVEEIARVLRDDGVVYAETPFLQPVHEGAYDYTRFTPAGHRMLFPQFDEIDSGPIGGPGSALVLAARHLVGGLARSQRAGRLTYLLLLPLVLLDRVVPVDRRLDACTGVWFLGRRAAADRLFDPAQVYRGAQ